MLWGVPQVEPGKVQRPARQRHALWTVLQPESAVAGEGCTAQLQGACTGRLASEGGKGGA